MNFLTKLKSSKPSGSSNLPEAAIGDRIYAVGDIHGRFDLWQDLLGQIRDHSSSLDNRKSRQIIILGDMIDRGEQSREVLEALYTAQRNRKVTVLLGNHEEAMLRAIDGEPGAMRSWLKFGGDATLRSFDIDPPGRNDEFDPIELARTFTNKIPEKWIDWLRSRPISARSNDYFFCHAGIKPGVVLKKQSRSDMLWIRNSFLNSDAAHGVVIVHGHSITPDIELRHNRIGVDTGAYRTGMLTAVYLEEKKCGVMSTGAPPKMDAFGVDLDRFARIE